MPAPSRDTHCREATCGNSTASTTAYGSCASVRQKPATSVGPRSRQYVSLAHTVGLKCNIRHLEWPSLKAWIIRFILLCRRSSRRYRRGSLDRLLDHRRDRIRGSPSRTAFCSWRTGAHIENMSTFRTKGSCRRNVRTTPHRNRDSTQVLAERFRHSQNKLANTSPPAQRSSALVNSLSAAGQRTKRTRTDDRQRARLERAAQPIPRRAARRRHEDELPGSSPARASMEESTWVSTEDFGLPSTPMRCPVTWHSSAIGRPQGIGICDAILTCKEKECAKARRGNSGTPWVDSDSA